MRPNIWPLPISFCRAAARAKPMMVSTSALMAAPANSGVAASAIVGLGGRARTPPPADFRSEEDTCEPHSQSKLVCRRLLEKKNRQKQKQSLIGIRRKNDRAVY